MLTEVDNPENLLGFIQYIIFNLRIEADIFYLYSYIGEVKNIFLNQHNHFLSEVWMHYYSKKMTGLFLENEVFLYSFMALLAESLLRNSVILNNS